MALVIRQPSAAPAATPAPAPATTAAATTPQVAAAPTQEAPATPLAATPAPAPAVEQTHQPTGADKVALLRAQRVEKQLRDEIAATKTAAAASDETIAKWKANPWQAAKELGISYEAWTQLRLKGEAPDAPTSNADARVEQLQRELAEQKALIEGLKTGADEAQKTVAQQAQLAREQRVAGDIHDFVSADTTRFPVLASIARPDLVIAEFKQARENDPGASTDIEVYALRVEQRIQGTLRSHIAELAKVPYALEQLRAILNSPAQSAAAPSTPSQQAPAETTKPAKGSRSPVNGRYLSATSRSKPDALPRKLPWNRNVHKGAADTLSQIVSDAKNGRA